MRVVKPFLLVSTPIGLALGVYEGFRFAGGLAVIIVAQILLLAAAYALLVRIARKEEAAGGRDTPHRDVATASTAALAENRRSS